MHAVVEVFSDWSGPCKSILPTFKKLRMEGRDEEVLSFLMISAEVCKQHEQWKEHQGKSEPLFLVYRVSKSCSVWELGHSGVKVRSMFTP